jgi:hypothetical protein
MNAACLLALPLLAAGDPAGQRFLRLVAALGAGYTLVVLLMLLVGGAGARRFRGQGALRLLGARPDQLLVPGEAVRFGDDPAATRLYALALLLGVAVFYAAVSLLIAALIVGTALLVAFLVRIPGRMLKLLILLVVVGGGLVWTLFRGLLAFPSRVGPGLPVKKAEHPRLHEVLAEVGQRLDAEPVSDVRLVPGALLRLDQEGRGPFGILGVRRRVLTLGWSALRLLSVGELQALLAREYVHDSRRGPFAARFLRRSVRSIHESLGEMRQEADQRLHVLPFYALLAAYHGAYVLLAAPYLRSREFLADRIASSLYGSDVFAAALTRTAIDAALYEMAVADAARAVPPNGEGVPAANAFRSARFEWLTDAERAELSARLRGEVSPPAAITPTVHERVEAVALLPRADHPARGEAVLLFEEPDRIEQELTALLGGTPAVREGAAPSRALRAGSRES